MSSDDDPRATTLRRCAKCGKHDVVCVHVTQHLLNGILSIGRTYRHQCRACSATFHTESVLRTAVEGIFAFWMLVFGGGFIAVFVSALPSLLSGLASGVYPGLREVGIAALFVGMFAFGAFLWIRSGIRWLNIARNPKV